MQVTHEFLDNLSFFLIIVLYQLIHQNFIKTYSHID